MALSSFASISSHFLLRSSSFSSSSSLISATDCSSDWLRVRRSSKSTSCRRRFAIVRSCWVIANCKFISAAFPDFSDRARSSRAPCRACLRLLTSSSLKRSPKRSVPTRPSKAKKLFAEGHLEKGRSLPSKTQTVTFKVGVYLQIRF